MHTYEAEKGDSIWIAAQKAVEIAKKERGRITLNFNDIPISVHPLSFPDDIAEIYNWRHLLRQETP